MERWAKVISRTAWAWIVAWPVLAGCVWWNAPRIPVLLKDDATGFFPADMPSQRALARLREEFPDHAPASRVAVVFVREAGLGEADQRFIGEIARALTARSAELGWQVRAVETAAYLRSLLESEDGQAAVIAVDLPAEMVTHSTVNRVRIVQRELADHAAPPGLEIAVTGTGAMGELLDRHAKRDIDQTTLWAFAAVTVILLVIYRSPIAMLLPIVTIGVSLMLSLGILGRAAAMGWPINGLVELFIIVMVVGSGVDYCLFLFARFGEEMSNPSSTLDDGVARAVEAAVSRSGKAVLASAGTNAVGLATLALAGDRDLHTSGPTIAFAIGVATLAVLTLAPSLMRVVGRRLLPDRRRTNGQPSEGAMWRWAARLATRHPTAVAMVMTAVLVPTAILGTRVDSLYDSLEEYPADSSFVRGAKLYHKHFFDARPVSEMSLILSTDAALEGPLNSAKLRETLDAIAATLAARLPILYQRDWGDPLGSRLPQSRTGSKAGTGDFLAGLAERMAGDYYLGRSRKSTRIDLGLRVEPRSVEGMETVAAVRSAVLQAVMESGLLPAIGGTEVTVDVSGESPLYADLRVLRARDFRIVSIAAVGSIFVILVWLIRSFIESAILILATLLTYLATYGATWWIIHQTYGLNGLAWQVDFLLFIIILSLGQDYNIFVVARIHEELRTRSPREAIDLAIRRTGRVVSSCGLIMAATFASMFSGSLMVMKEMAIALSLGILIDTFVVRPLLVPAMILLFYRWTRSPASEAVLERSPRPAVAGR